MHELDNRLARARLRLALLAMFRRHAPQRVTRAMIAKAAATVKRLEAEKEIAMTQVSRGAMKIAQRLVTVIPNPDDDYCSVHVGADKVEHGGVIQEVKDEHTANLIAMKMIQILALAMDEHARNVLDIERGTR
jgi:hypothetical protein